jgi:hypothetical protein
MPVRRGSAGPLVSVAGPVAQIEFVAAGRLFHRDLDAYSGAFVSGIGEGWQAAVVLTALPDKPELLRPTLPVNRNAVCLPPLGSIRVWQRSAQADGGGQSEKRVHRSAAELDLLLPCAFLW